MQHHPRADPGAREDKEEREDHDAPRGAPHAERRRPGRHRRCRGARQRERGGPGRTIERRIVRRMSAAARERGMRAALPMLLARVDIAGAGLVGDASISA